MRPIRWGRCREGEYTLIDGTAANGSNRWGDYAAMTVDPVDDCTFWFTGEYMTTGEDWATQSALFHFSSPGYPVLTLSTLGPGATESGVNFGNQQTDSTPPTVNDYDVADITETGGATHAFTITYTDDVAVDVSDLDAFDIRVTGPGSYDQLATFVSVDVATDGTPRTAMYRIQAQARCGIRPTTAHTR